MTKKNFVMTQKSFVMTQKSFDMAQKSFDTTEESFITTFNKMFVTTEKSFVTSENNFSMDLNDFVMDENIFFVNKNNFVMAGVGHRKYHTNHIAEYCIFLKVSSRIYNLNILYIALRVEINFAILSKVSVIDTIKLPRTRVSPRPNRLSTS